MNNKVRILIDISDLQRGFSGIMHDLVGHIKILQNFDWLEISFLYIEYNKFIINPENIILDEINKFFEKEEINPGKIILRRRWNYFDKFLKFFSINPTRIDTSEFDYVFVQSNFYYDVSSSSKLLVRLHDMIYVSHPETISNHFLNKVFFLNTLKFLFKKTNKLILTNSKTTTTNLLKYFPNLENIQELNCPIQPPFQSNDTSELSVDSPYLIFCSTIEPKKNIIFLCDLFKEFNKNHSDYKLVIIGKVGWKFKEIVKKINLTPNVIWFQKVSDKQRDELYRNSKCFVFPSIVEGFGMPPLEAMRSGVPVLSSDIPVHREIQGDFAWFAELGNINDFVGKLEYIINADNSEEVFLKTKGAMDWVKKYDPSNFLDTWIKILK